MTTSTNNKTQRQAVSNDEIQTVAEQLFAEEVFACQTDLITNLMDRGEFSFATQDVWNAYVETASGEKQLAYVYEWWLVSPSLTDRLARVDQPVLENRYGQRWGRTAPGQPTAMDATLQKIARRMLAEKSSPDLAKTSKTD